MLVTPKRRFLFLGARAPERGRVMLRYLGKVFRGTAYVGRVARRRPKTVALLTVVVLLGAGVGLYRYALHQWHAARRALKEDRPAEALARLDFCLALWPRDPDVHFLAARAARLNGDFQSAESHLNRCLKLHNGATEAIQLEFLLLRVQTGEVDDVAPALLQCVEQRHPETPLILETLARSYMHHLRLQPAYACLTRWIEETPNSAKPFHWRGWVQERLGNSKRAMEDYRRALELDPELVQVRLRVAEMLLEDNDPLEALLHLERLRRLFPDRADITARLGQCRFLQGQREEARRLLESAVQELPNDLPLLLHLAKLELQEDRPVQAEHWLRRMLEVDPSDTEARYTLIAALRLQGRTEEAAAVLAQYEKNKAMVERINHLLRQAADRPNNTASVPSEIGALLLRIGRERLGLYWLDQALLREPEHQATHRALAEHYQSKGEREKAEMHRRRLTDVQGRRRDR